MGINGRAGVVRKESEYRIAFAVNPSTLILSAIVSKLGRSLSKAKDISRARSESGVQSGMVQLFWGAVCTDKRAAKNECGITVGVSIGKRKSKWDTGANDSEGSRKSQCAVEVLEAEGVAGTLKANTGAKHAANFPAAQLTVSHLSVPSYQDGFHSLEAGGRTSNDGRYSVSKSQVACMI
jgi:hypothetical protein